MITRPKDPTVAVVIPARNAEGTLDAQLEALAPQVRDLRAEVIVSDNGSTDGTRGVVERLAAEHELPFRRIDSSAVPGVSHARNAGVQAGASDIVLICDSDDVVRPDWIREMVAALRHADVVGGALETRSLNAPAVRAWRSVPPPAELPTLLDFLPYATGCNVGVWRDVVDAVGGWDETLRAGGDDVDFSWRAQLQGFTLAAAPRAVTAYRLRETLRGSMSQLYAYGRAETGIYHRFAGDGVRIPSASRRAFDLVRLARRLPGALTDGDRRGAVLVTCALLTGKLVATLDYRWSTLRTGRRL